MAEYIEIDAPIDVAVYQRNRRIKVTLRQILESNDAKYQAADVRPVVRAKWKWNDNNGYYYCGNCKAVSPREDQDGEYIDYPNFCPNCGADMREES